MSQEFYVFRIWLEQQISTYNMPRRHRGILYPFFNLGTRWGGWSTPHPGHFIPGKVPVLTVQEAAWTPQPFWTLRKISPQPGFEPRTVQPVASRYINYAIPAHCLEQY